MTFGDPNYRDSTLARLIVLRSLREYGLVNDDLEWVDKARRAFIR